jgi:hypothetical protein
MLQVPGLVPTLETFGGEVQVNGVGPVGHVPYLGSVHLGLAFPYTRQELPCSPCNESQDIVQGLEGSLKERDATMAIGMCVHGI